MKQCPVCKSGKVVQSGTHEYCNNCNYSQFMLTDNYIDSCVNVMATLTSNTRFASKEVYQNIVRQHIYKHLPVLSYWLNTLQHEANFIDRFCEDTMTQAINLVIDQEVINEEKNNDLVCQCGCSSFNLVTQRELTCVDCGALFEYDEAQGIYVPYFLCSCGNVKYEEIDLSGLCECTQCQTAYIHDKEHKIFRRVLA